MTLKSIPYQPVLPIGDRCGGRSRCGGLRCYGVQRCFNAMNFYLYWLAFAFTALCEPCRQTCTEALWS